MRVITWNDRNVRWGAHSKRFMVTCQLHTWNPPSTCEVRTITLFETTMDLPLGRQREHIIKDLMTMNDSSSHQTSIAHKRISKVCLERRWHHLTKEMRSYQCIYKGHEDQGLYSSPSLMMNQITPLTVLSKLDLVKSWFLPNVQISSHQFRHLRKYPDSLTISPR